MSVAMRLPTQIVYLLPSPVQAAIASAAAVARDKALARVQANERRARQHAQAVQSLQAEANEHVVVCGCSLKGRPECVVLRAIKADMALEGRRYDRALKRLKGGR